MRFLIDADLPRSSGKVVEQAGHHAVDARDVGLREAKDPVIAAYAKREGLCLITGDFDFSDIRNYPPAEYPGLVVLQLPKDATAAQINAVLAGFMARGDLIDQMPGKLAIVSAGQIRLRSGR